MRAIGGWPSGRVGGGDAMCVRGIGVGFDGGLDVVVVDVVVDVVVVVVGASVVMMRDRVFWRRLFCPGSFAFKLAA
jgi:hypothetical protein